MDARADLQANLDKMLNRTPGKEAKDLAGQIIGQNRSYCEKIRMDFIEGEGCFVPGSEKPPSPDEIATMRDSAEAEAHERQTANQLNDAERELHAASKEVNVLDHQLQRKPKTWLGNSRDPDLDLEKGLANAKARESAARSKSRQLEGAEASALKAVLQAENQQINASMRESVRDQDRL